jgi:hypothetical protein
VPILFLWVEFVTVGDRPLEVEKMWGAIYGAGLVTVLPLAFAQRGLLFRILEVFMLVIMAICFGWWLKVDYSNIDSTVLCRLQGDFYIQADPQRRRLEQVLDRFHDRIVLPGKAVWAYNQAPAVIDFTRNRCYIAWSFQEDECGHPDEPAYREKMNNSFYAGTMADPLAFLRANDIEAVLIWPEDKISDGLLDKFKREIGSDYFYIDCKMDMPDNAGLFVRQRLMAGSPPAPVSVASPVPAPSSGSRRIGF